MINQNFNIGQGLQGIKRFFKNLSCPHSAVGVDIGSQSIKLIELSRKNDRLILTNYAYAKTDESLVKIGAPGVLSDMAGKVLSKSLEASKIKAKEVNVAVPSFSSLVTVFEIPRMSEKEIDQAIRVEAPKYIPVRLSDVVYGWQIIDYSTIFDGNTKQKGQFAKAPIEAKRSERMKVLVVAIMREISNKYEKVLGNAGIGIGSLEIDSFSLSRALLSRESECSLILDIGHRVTNLIVGVKSNILVNRTIDVAGESMTGVLGKGLGVDERRAEQLKMQKGLQNISQGEQGLLAPILGVIVQEVKKTVDVLKEEYDGLSVKKIILSGGSSRMIGLREFIEQESGIETTIANSLIGIEYPSKLNDNLKEQSPVLATAVGLAMLGLKD